MSAPPTSMPFRPTVAALALVVLVGVLVVGAATSTPIGALTRDPNQILDDRAWNGLVSIVGYGLWAAAAAALALAAVFRPDQRSVLGALSALTVLMFVDDALLLHDAAFPTLGVPEIVVMAAYGALAATAVWQARAWLTASPVRPWTALAAALFAVSVLADLIDWRSWGDDLLFAVEDGSKFVAIALWVDIALWCAITAARPRTDGARGGT